MTTIFPRAWTRAAASAALLLGSAGGCGTEAGPAMPSGEAGPAADAPRADAPAGPPPRPLDLAEPAEPPRDRDGVDLSEAGGRALASAAGRLAAKGDHREAARLQFWARKAGAGGSYNLACWTALAGDPDAAFFWLQDAALGEGVDASWAAQDSDLESLRKDARWKRVGPFLKLCNAYWAASGLRETSLVVPSGYRPGTPIAVVVGMHGMGDRPDHFIDAATFQPIADELGMAFVGVGGTVPVGRRKFVWSEDPEADAAHVRRALDDLSGRLTARPGHLIALGFSQGAQLGFEVAFKYPGEYRGAIVISPGTTNRFFRLRRLAPAPANKGQGYVCLCGAGEYPGNVEFTRSDADFAARAGARVDLRLAEGQAAHAFPADFAAKIAGWVRFVDEGGEKAPE